MRTILLVCLLLFSVPASPANPPALVINTYPRISSAPATIRVRITLTQDPQNRALCLQVDGTEFRSSCWEIDAQRAPRTAERWVKDLPAGCYTATAAVGREDGTTRFVSEEFRVVGFEEETEGC